MKDGASDYVLKDRLQRLPQAGWNAMEKLQADCDNGRSLRETASHPLRFGLAGALGRLLKALFAVCFASAGLRPTCKTEK